MAKKFHLKFSAAFKIFKMFELPIINYSLLIILSHCEFIVISDIFIINQQAKWEINEMFFGGQNRKDLFLTFLSNNLIKLLWTYTSNTAC